MVEIKKGAGTKLLSKLKSMLFTSEMRQGFTEESNLSFRFSALTKNSFKAVDQILSVHKSENYYLFPQRMRAVGCRRLKALF